MDVKHRPILRKEHRFGLQNGMLRRIFRLKRKRDRRHKEGRIKLQNKELHNLYSSQNVTRELDGQDV
jgi:hypothetical protein